MTIYARTSSEIAEDIKKQQEALNNTQNSLDQAKKNLEYINSLANNPQGGLAQLENEIKKLEAEIETNKYELELTKKNKELKELEKAQNELKQNSSLKTMYMEWRINNSTDLKEVLHSFDIKKYEIYSQTLTSSQQGSILGIANDLENIKSDIGDYEAQLASLDVKSKELQQKKQDLENQIKYYNNQVYALGNKVSNLKGSISDLSEQQRQAVIKEEEILRQNEGALGNTDCQKDPNAPAGTIFFCGNGRDLYQGHGVGFSQFGARGMGLLGYTAQQMINFYYTGVNIASGYETRTVNVNGYGTMNVETYVAGLGEVPSKACGTAEQVAARPDKYTTYNGNVWSCWPEETIKAQVIIARTYGLRSGTVCTTAACQVYTGTTAKQWAADETRGQVILYGGNFISAVYSSDNNQGHGTADNDTSFQWDVTGSASVMPYLRSVNDTQFAQISNGGWGLWKWKTYSYTMNDINSFLSSSGLGGWVNEMGGVASISFTRDPSLRVKYVFFTGTNGVQKRMGGWWFKNYWITWAANKGTNDFIYSLTFSMNTN